MSWRLALRWFAAILAAYGAFAAYGITSLHLRGAEPCPTIIGIPACILVMAGYLAMIVGIIRLRGWIFLIGWLPVFLLASAGVAGELLSDTPVCPQTDTGIPKCYFSFALSSLLGLLGFALLRKRAEA